MSSIRTAAVAVLAACIGMPGAAALDCSCTVRLGSAAVTVGGTSTVMLSITNTSRYVCSFDWQVAKLSGSPTVNIVPNQGRVLISPGSDGNATIQLGIPAASSARDSAGLQARVTGDGDCMSFTSWACPIPSGETTAFDRWGAGNDAAQGLWNQILQPATADFSGRSVTEQNPGGGGPDTCWFAGSAIPKFTSISGGTWPIGGGNAWGADYVGWYVNAVTYYRAQGQAPCSTRFPQTMVINCPHPLNLQTYQNNMLGAGMGTTTVTTTRAGQFQTKPFP